MRPLPFYDSITTSRLVWFGLSDPSPGGRYLRFTLHTVLRSSPEKRGKKCRSCHNRRRLTEPDATDDRTPSLIFLPSGTARATLLPILATGTGLRRRKT
jgi:hypothetical protein